MGGRRRLRVLLDPQLLEHDLRRLHQDRVQQHGFDPDLRPRLGHSGACDPNYSLWQIGTHHDWFPLPGLRFAVDVLYTGVDSAFAGQTVTVAKAQGARPTGVYQAKDLGLTSVMFRAQRTWGGGD